MNDLGIVFLSFSVLLIILYIFIRYEERHGANKK